MRRQFLFPLLLSLLFVGGLAASMAFADDLAKPITPSVGRGSATNALAETEIARCTVRKDANGWWLVSPKDEPFFSLGVCMFNQGLDKSDYDPAKPSYAAFRHYDTPNAWADASLLRLKSWGFTTVGGWSDYDTLGRSREHDLWMTCVLNLGARSGAPWFDMWDEKVIRRIDELAEEAIAPLRGDPRLIGYFSDNELGWWNAILWKMTLEQPPSSGQRQRLIAMVRDVYGSDWDRLIKDFEPQKAASWKELDRGGMLWLRPGSNGIRTMRRFLGLVADRYYEVMSKSIHRFDPGALYLGDRYQSFYYPELPAASRRHVDVVSTNLNVSWNDGTFIHCYFDMLHKLSGRPVLVSEFYMAAEENESGNRNKVGGFPIVISQKDRAEALSNTLRALVQLPYVVGADWFQYYDEPTHGRALDGEDYNFGLVDIHDQPYAEVTAAFKSFNFSRLKSARAHRGPNATAGVPPAPIAPMDEFRSMTALKNWDRERGFVPPATQDAVGDLYVCWSSNALYLGTLVVDIVEPDYYRDGNIPDVDRATWTIRVNNGESVTARIGAGKDAAISNPAARIKSLSGTYHEVRCITVVELPAGQLGKQRLAPGDQIALESSFSTHGRANSIQWKGTFVLSD